MEWPTLALRELTWPADWPAIFGRDGPLVIEVGFGGGDFLLDLARRRPDANVLGLEISLPSLAKTEGKIIRSGLANVRLLHATALTLLWALCRPAGVAALMANFPDPWPKAAHHGRRLINDRFLSLAANRLRPGGTLNVATDHADYATWIARCLEQSPYFESRDRTPFLTEDSDRLRTKYELKALAEGRACHYFRWQRTALPAPDLFPIPPELPMPHAVIATALTLEAVQLAFRPHQWTRAGAAVRLVDAYRSIRSASVVVDTYVEEEPLSQRLLLAITARGEGELLVHLHEVGFPRPTPGTHQAIAWLVQWLLELEPAGQVAHHNLRPEALAAARPGPAG
jgi:tRNA (guanine-N7-)-methyltransferase